MKITEKDIEFLSHLRRDCRRKITHISNDMKMPVTTAYDKLRSHVKNGVIRKSVSLIDYNKLGYNVNAMIALKSQSENKDGLKKFLLKHPHVNSLYKINFGNDFLVEVVFENMARLEDFIDSMSEFNLESPKIFNIISEIRKEEFLS